MDQSQLKEIDCQTCKLIYYYTHICQHNNKTSNEDHLDSWKKLQEVMQKETNEANLDEKIKALRNVMRSLDAMSVLKEAAITIVRGQFSDVLTMFLRKDLNSLLGDKSEMSCNICSYGGETLLIIEHALLILNRCLIQQIDAVITNTT